MAVSSFYNWRLTPPISVACVHRRVNYSNLVGFNFETFLLHELRYAYYHTLIASKLARNV